MQLYRLAVRYDPYNGSLGVKGSRPKEGTVLLKYEIY